MAQYIDGQSPCQAKRCLTPLIHPGHATLWTLIASAERHGIDPQKYLTSVLAKLPTTPPDELDQFLPDVWKAEDAAEPATTS